MDRLLLALQCVAFTCVMLFTATEGHAQDSQDARGAPSVWVQIEARPSLAEARDRAMHYAAALPAVNGFMLGRGWYAIALGPFGRPEADRVLRDYRRQGMIPRDSYITRSSDYQGQFWPVGVSLLDQPVPDESSRAAAPEDTREDTPQETAQETPREARASESRLSREERFELQTALTWAGVYDGAIDAAFGRGTRAAMARWQEKNGFDPTGVLSTSQRDDLLRHYKAVLEGLDLERIEDRATGIALDLPTAVVDFERYEPPFAHFASTGDLDARVLLISQSGDRSTMNDLYEIMQTLEIVPETGPRSLERDGFTLVGEGALEISHTRVWYRDGDIKGFTLIWPAGDEERRNRLLREMLDSFEWLPGTLDPAEGDASLQRVDLVSGLALRKPRLTRSGFYVDDGGAVLTTADAVRHCGRVTIDDVYTAGIVLVDDALNVAVLRPDEPLAPAQVAAFLDRAPRLQSDVAVAGFSYGGLLGAPSVTFGQVSDLMGLNGEPHIKRLTLTALDGDAGGPVLDVGGSVLGMLLAPEMGDRRLPDTVSFAANNGALQDVMARSGIEARETSDTGILSAEALTDRATAMTVLVSCWD